MAWDTTMTTIFRTLILDFDGSLFSDDRVKQILAVSAQYVITEIDFPIDYTVNVITPDISPDPTTSDPVDDVFINFVVLRAACMIDQGAIRSAALTAGLEAKCGPATMRTLRRMDGFNTLMDQGYCATYEQLKKEYQFGNVAFCRAIMSPFINAEFFPQYHSRGAPIIGISELLRANRR